MGYDGEADVLYISFAPPRPAVVWMWRKESLFVTNEQAREVAGLTIIGVGRRLEEYIRKNA